MLLIGSLPRKPSVQEIICHDDSNFHGMYDYTGALKSARPQQGSKHKIHAKFE
jgi:hypothetical protein